MTVTHIAGEVVTIHIRGGEYMRQRCGWCGETLLEYDLSRVAVPVDQPGPPAAWPVGGLVAGGVSHVSHGVDGLVLPEDACALNPLTLASFG